MSYCQRWSDNWQFYSLHTIQFFFVLVPPYLWRAGLRLRQCIVEYRNIVSSSSFSSLISVFNQASVPDTTKTFLVLARRGSVPLDVLNVWVFLVSGLEPHALDILWVFLFYFFVHLLLWNSWGSVLSCWSCSPVFKSFIYPFPIKDTTVILLVFCSLCVSKIVCQVHKW